MIRPKPELANVCPGAAVQSQSVDEFKRKVLNSILLDITAALPRSILLPFSGDAGIDETTSLSDAYTRLKMLVVQKRQYYGYACVLCGWIELVDLITGDSPYIGNTWTAESASSMAIFSLRASKTAMNALVEFLVQTPYIGPDGSLKDELFGQLRGVTEDKLHMTPDQKQKTYRAAMMLGPLKLLHTLFDGNKVSFTVVKPFMNAILWNPGSPLLI
jgi:hypothetical protein